MVCFELYDALESCGAPAYHAREATFEMNKNC